MSDEELLQGFARVLKDKKDIDSPEKLLTIICAVFFLMSIQVLEKNARRKF